MLRTHFIKTARIAVPRRLLSTTPRVMAGETGSGASRPGGERAGDAFTKRERSAEEYYIHEEEKAKLLAIREKLRAQKQHIEELDKHM
ncbi:uncharacterized protein BDZ99DRAFT_411634, partial [Mytilinidion resinicola]